jgi:hypothetical protein
MHDYGQTGEFLAVVKNSVQRRVRTIGTVKHCTFIYDKGVLRIREKGIYGNSCLFGNAPGFRLEIIQAPNSISPIHHVFLAIFTS